MITHIPLAYTARTCPECERTGPTCPGDLFLRALEVKGYTPERWAEEYRENKDEVMAFIVGKVRLHPEMRQKLVQFTNIHPRVWDRLEKLWSDYLEAVHKVSEKAKKGKKRAPKKAKKKKENGGGE